MHCHKKHCHQERRKVPCWALSSLFPHKLLIWPACGAVWTGGMHNDLTTMWWCVYWWNARWSDHHVVLCGLVECTMILPLCGAVLTGGMYNDPTTVWCCVDWWNTRWSDHRVVLCWLVECTIIWPPCGTVLTGGMHGDLTTIWYCGHWWKALWSDHHVVLCWLVECTMIWPPCGTVLTCGVHNKLSLIPAFRLIYSESFDCTWQIASEVDRRKLFSLPKFVDTCTLIDLELDTTCTWIE